MGTSSLNLRLVVFMLASVLGGVSMAIEEPVFTVESKTDDYEIRRYSPMIVAETVVETEFDEAGNQAFRILADYIFGNNQAKAKLEVTSVSTESPTSEKIAMTAPVSQIKAAKGFLVQFTMPVKYTLETLPTPNDSRVQLREIPARKVAAFSYSGSWSKDRYDEKLSEFKNHLSKAGLKTKGEPIFARFNSPFMIWFLRRNEIWIEVVE